MNKSRRAALKAAAVNAFEQAIAETYAPLLLEEITESVLAKRAAVKKAAASKKKGAAKEPAIDGQTTEAALKIWRELSGKIQDESQKRRRKGGIL
jgi:hypothetical protein